MMDVHGKMCMYMCVILYCYKHPLSAVSHAGICEPGVNVYGVFSGVLILSCCLCGLPLRPALYGLGLLWDRAAESCSLCPWMSGKGFLRFRCCECDVDQMSGLRHPDISLITDGKVLKYTLFLT